MDAHHNYRGVIYPGFHSIFNLLHTKKKIHNSLSQGEYINRCYYSMYGKWLELSTRIFWGKMKI